MPFASVFFRSRCSFLVLAGFLAVLSAQPLPAPPGWTVNATHGKLIFVPDQISASQQVVVEVFDAEAAQGPIDAWLLREMPARGASSADLKGCRPKVDNGKSATCVTKSNGADQYWCAFLVPDGRFRFARVVMGPNTLTTMKYLSVVGRVLKGAEQGLGSAAGSMQGTGPATPPSERLRGRSPSAGNAASGWGDAPASGATASTPTATQEAVPHRMAVDGGSPYVVPIKAICLHLEYIAGVGGGIYPSYEPYVLLTDGTVTDDLRYYPTSQQDVENWRRQKPRAWGRWSEAPGRLSIQWNDSRRKPETWDKWFVARPASPGMKLSGRFTSIGGGGNTALGGNVMIAAWSDYTFQPDGTVTSGGGAGGGNPSVTVHSERARQSAHYNADGYSIDFEYSDGSRSRSWFYRFPDGDDVLGIGSKTLTRSK